MCIPFVVAIPCLEMYPKESIKDVHKSMENNKVHQPMGFTTNINLLKGSGNPKNICQWIGCTEA